MSDDIYDYYPIWNYASRHPEAMVEIYSVEHSLLEFNRDDPFVLGYLEQGGIITYPNPNPWVDNPPKIVKLIPLNLRNQGSFQGANYNTDIVDPAGNNSRLYKKVYMDRGEIYKVEYYRNCVKDTLGNLTFGDLIVVENYQYARDSFGKSTERLLTINWLCDFPDENGQPVYWPVPKLRRKFYSDQESIAEGLRKRENIINDSRSLIRSTLILNGLSEQQAENRVTHFFISYKERLDLFLINEEYYNMTVRLRDDLEFSWLNNLTTSGQTLRNVLMSYFTRPTEKVIT
jgi:hypothetical protein